MGSSQWAYRGIFCKDKKLVQMEDIILNLYVPNNIPSKIEI